MSLPRLRVVTYNCGLLDYRLFGISCLTNPAFVRERFPHVVTALKSIAETTDVLLLQEVYDKVHINAIVTALSEELPNVAKYFSGGFLKLNNGLLVLSRHHISHFAFHQYRKVDSRERRFATKGFLEVVVTTEAWGKLCFTNHHTTAGGNDSVPESETEEWRQDELQQSLDVLRERVAEGCECFIAGDLNTGHTYSPHNLRFLVENGWTDSWAATNGGSEDGFTWENKNLLNAQNVHASSPSARVDHIMPHSEGSLVPSSSHLLFADTVVDVLLDSQQERVTASDHLGLCVEFVHRVK